MDPKSSDGDTTEGEITDLETTKSTEGSTEDDSPASKRLKTDEEEEEEEEEEKDSCESDQKWGYDSFDDTEYESDHDDNIDFEWNRYLCHVYSSKGFKVDKEIIPKRPFIGFRPFNFNGEFLPNISGREYMDNMAKMALDKYNEHHGTHVTFDHVVRVVVKWSTGVKSYITFMAKESPQGELIEYQAKTQWKVWQKNSHVILCRPALPMKPIPEKYLPPPWPPQS